ncbi:uncharacterized protein UHOD_01892 [Ustilago sp. UG-2017b]|nr:uncharacterized protein UHOD_01892 [Ustilago sp. UG-2017b]
MGECNSSLFGKLTLNVSVFCKSTCPKEAERQIRNLAHNFATLHFPGPLLRIFRDRAAAEDFLANSGRFTQQFSIQDEADNELLERTRIFNGLDPNSEPALRRTLGMSAERKEARRRSRLLITSQAATRQEAATPAVHSPPLSLKCMSSDPPPISPFEEINGFGSFPTSVPLQSISLLSVKHLASSVAFYAKVLGFNSTVSRTSMIRASSLNGATRSDPLTHGRPALPTILSCTDPEPLDLSLTTFPLRSSATSTLSGQTVLIEYSGALKSMNTLLSAKHNEWRLERTKAAAAASAQASQTNGTRPSQPDMARILSGVQQTPWDAQELHLCDLDGHRIICTTPFARA